MWPFCTCHIVRVGECILQNNDRVTPYVLQGCMICRVNCGLAWSLGVRPSGYRYVAIELCVDIFRTYLTTSLSRPRNHHIHRHNTFIRSITSSMHRYGRKKKKKHTFMGLIRECVIPAYGSLCIMMRVVLNGCVEKLLFQHKVAPRAC